MRFKIPRENTSEMVLYIWKIINFPYISYNDLLYRISFDLSLLNPKEAEKFIADAIRNGFLIKENNKLKLFEKLNSKFINWQNTRRDEILDKINSYKSNLNLKNKFEKNKKTEFNIILKALTDKSTLNRSVSVLESTFNLKTINLDEGLIEGNVKGSKEEPYTFSIDFNKKELKHNCHDFQTRRAKNKKFCKHLVRLFLLLKEREGETATLFLKKISNDIENWDFLN